MGGGAYSLKIFPENSCVNVHAQSQIIGKSEKFSTKINFSLQKMTRANDIDYLTNMMLHPNYRKLCIGVKLSHYLNIGLSSLLIANFFFHLGHNALF